MIDWNVVGFHTAAEAILADGGGFARQLRGRIITNFTGGKQPQGEK